MRTWSYHVRDWPHLARISQFSCKRLALRLDVSPRQLQRHFQQVHRLEARKWLMSVRLFDARHLLASRKSVKEVAYLLSYRQSSHFSREFKRLFRISPERFVRSNFVGNPQFELLYSELWQDKISRRPQKCRI